jgi:hypothetical protein
MKKPPHAAAENWVGKVENEETAPRRRRKLGRKSGKRENRPAAPPKVGAEKRKKKKPPHGTIYRLTMPEYYGRLLDEKCDWSYQFVRIYNHRGV